MIQDGHVVLLRAPQTDQHPGKIRPVLVLRRLPGRHDDWLVCTISTRLHHAVDRFDEIVHDQDDDFSLSGLKKESLIRIGRLAVVEQSQLLGKIGRLSEERIQRIKSRLANWIQERPKR